MLASEFLYSPLFLLAVNAVLAAGIVLAVRRLKGSPHQQVQLLQDPYSDLRSLIESETEDRKAYVIGVGRAVREELLRIRELGLGRSSTMRETIRALAAQVGRAEEFEEFAAIFERVRYGGEVPDDEMVAKFRAVASAILEALHRRAPIGHA